MNGKFHLSIISSMDTLLNYENLSFIAKMVLFIYENRKNEEATSLLSFTTSHF